MKRIIRGILVLALVIAAVPVTIASAQTEDTSNVARRALAITNADSVIAGEPMKVLVTDTRTSRPAEKAGVWAIDLNNISATVTDAAVYADLAAKCGFFLGWTNQDGYVWPLPSLKVPGKYILVAAKDGCVPGFSRIAVLPRPALSINAPDRAAVNRPVTIQVIETNAGAPVVGAGVWAIDVAKTPVASATDETVVELAKACGQFLGWTNNRGFVWPYPVFENPGSYVLVAFKDGYKPGFDKITIVKLAITPVDPLPVKPRPVAVDLISSKPTVTSVAPVTVKPINTVSASIAVEPNPAAVGVKKAPVNVDEEKS